MKKISRNFIEYINNSPDFFILKDDAHHPIVGAFVTVERRFGISALSFVPNVRTEKRKMFVAFGVAYRGDTLPEEMSAIPFLLLYPEVDYTEERIRLTLDEYTRSL